MQRVIFDSSFLMAVAENPTTWFQDIVAGLGSFEPILPACVRDELSKLASGRGKRAREARVALDLASNFASIPCGKAAVDDEIVSAALTKGALVATTDADLVLSLRAAHLKVVSLRSGRVALG
ncbi:MAG: twitching motility protein PilT [Thaumarchaeota archaeon]|nr:twitching motility protein PilT [Nitrososphaerota archaeon]